MQLCNMYVCAQFLQAFCLQPFCFSETNPFYFFVRLLCIQLLLLVLLVGSASSSASKIHSEPATISSVTRQLTHCSHQLLLLLNQTPFFCCAFVLKREKLVLSSLVVVSLRRERFSFNTSATPVFNWNNKNFQFFYLEDTYKKGAPIFYTV